MDIPAVGWTVVFRTVATKSTEHNILQVPTLPYTFSQQCNGFTKLQRSKDASKTVALKQTSWYLQ